MKRNVAVLDQISFVFIYESMILMHLEYAIDIWYSYKYRIKKILKRFKWDLCGFTMLFNFNNLIFVLIQAYDVFQKRLKKELQALVKDPPVGIHLDQESISSSLAEYVELILDSVL